MIESYAVKIKSEEKYLRDYWSSIEDGKPFCFKSIMSLDKARRIKNNCYNINNKDIIIVLLSIEELYEVY